MKDGLILVDKPVGFTSFDVIRVARKQLNIKKIGHSGTLDPFATGLLILGINKGTKALQHLLGEDKIYEAVFELGITSDTLDNTGVISSPPVKGELEGVCFSKKQIMTTLETFGKQYPQMPPQFSAKKINGEPAYKKARRGEKVDLKPKLVDLHGFEVLNIEKNKIRLRLNVGSGFYVRSFAHDLAVKLDTVGLCSELRRISIGKFLVEDAVQPKQISEEDIRPGRFLKPGRSV